MLNDLSLTVYIIQFCAYKVSRESRVIMAPHKIKKEGYFLRSCDSVKLISNIS